MAALGAARFRFLARSKAPTLVAGYVRIIDPDRNNPWALVKQSSRKPKIAALIDGDQVPPSHFTPVLDALSEHGQVSLRRFYASEHKAKIFAKELLSQNIQPVVVPRGIGGRKDPNDMAIALDAAELVLAPAKGAKGGGVVGVAVVSSDTDFKVLLRRVRDWGAQAYVVMARRGGFVSAGVRAGYEAAGSVVVPYAVPYAIEEEPKQTEECIFFEGGKLTVKQLPVDVVAEDLTEEQDAELVRVLTSLGYLARGADGVSLDALIKFFHVNQLGNCMVFPRGLVQAFHAINDGRRALVRDPGNIVLLDRVTYGNNWQKRLRAGGPRLLIVSAALVGEVLSCCGFTDDVEKIDEDVVAAFCEVNCRRLEKQHLDLSGLTLTEKVQSLHACFATQHVRQQWRIMFSDVSVREKLHAEKRIHHQDSSRKVVLKALKKYLRELGIDGAAGFSYNRAVISFERHRGRNDPELRK